MNDNELINILELRKDQYIWALREFWTDIADSLASENLHEDGEISNAQTEHKRSGIYADAMEVYRKKHYCPKDIAECCDDDLFAFVKAAPPL